MVSAKCEAKVVPDGYTTTQCTGGYEQDGETFVSGETNYYKCKARDCSAFKKRKPSYSAKKAQREIF